MIPFPTLYEQVVAINQPLIYPTKNEIRYGYRKMVLDALQEAKERSNGFQLLSAAQIAEKSGLSINMISNFLYELEEAKKVRRHSVGSKVFMWSIA